MVNGWESRFWHRRFQARRGCIEAAFAGCLVVALSVWPTPASSETRSYALEGFDGVSTSSGIQMVVELGEDFSVTAESDEARQLDLLELDVRRGTLRARMDNRLFALRGPEGWKVTVYVSVPKLVHADASSGSNLTIDEMADDAVELEASSGSVLQVVNLTATSISASASSGARIAATAGTCSELEAVASTGSSLDFAGVECAEVEINASSGSNASVFADDRIDARAANGSSVHVHGARRDMVIDTSSGGSIVLP